MDLSLQRLPSYHVSHPLSTILFPISRLFSTFWATLSKRDIGRFWVSSCHARSIPNWGVASLHVQQQQLFSKVLDLPPWPYIASGILTTFVSFETTDSQEFRGLPGGLFHCVGVGTARARLGSLYPFNFHLMLLLCLVITSWFWGSINWIDQQIYALKSPIMIFASCLFPLGFIQ